MAGPLIRSLFSSIARKSLKPYFFSIPRALSFFSASATAVASTTTAFSSLDPSRLRNVAVIAHVDHGKTTLMDRLLRQCGADIPHERAMDSITISSKINPVRVKELTNVRAASKDETVRLSPPRQMTLEEAIGYVASEELIEVTPKAIRLRKKYLDVNKRKTMSKRPKE